MTPNALDKYREQASELTPEGMVASVGLAIGVLSRLSDENVSDSPMFKHRCIYGTRILLLLHTELSKAASTAALDKMTRRQAFEHYLSNCGRTGMTFAGVASMGMAIHFNNWTYAHPDYFTMLVAALLIILLSGLISMLGGAGYWAYTHRKAVQS